MEKIYRGTDFYLPVRFLRRVNESAINIATWDFEAQFREDPASDDIAITTSLSGNHWSLTNDGTDGKLNLRLTAAQTANLPLGVLHGDLFRIDSGLRQRLCLLRIPVEDPITRD